MVTWSLLYSLNLRIFLFFFSNDWWNKILRMIKNHYIQSLTNCRGMWEFACHLLEDSDRWVWILILQLSIFCLCLRFSTIWLLIIQFHLRRRAFWHHCYRLNLFELSHILLSRYHYEGSEKAYWVRVFCRELLRQRFLFTIKTL